MKYLTFIIIFSLIAGCRHEAQESIPLNNSEIKLELLFEHDGCKIYRFIDGNAVYWTDCSGQVKSEYRTRSGKNTTIHHDRYSITTK